MQYVRSEFTRHIDLRGAVDIAALVRKQSAAGHIALEFVYEFDGLWPDLIKDPAYAVGMRCASVLAEIAQKPDWERALAARDGLVELGPGTGEKTAMLAGLIGREADILPVILIDVSRELLKLAANKLRKVDRRLELVACHADFRRLALLMHHPAVESHAFTKPRGCLVFSVLGNTFANLNERRTLAMFQKVMRPGDLLILSLDFGQIGDAASPDAELLASYAKSPAAQRIFSAPFRRLGGPVPHIGFAIRRGDPAFSCLRSTRTVVPSAWHNGKRITVGHSNRYRWDDLIGLIEQHGFRLRLTARSKDGGLTRYLGFERA
jgi:hypothetical protein